LSADVAAWNPFEDIQPFNQLTEDHIFGAEFDKIRRGSNSSVGDVKSRESLVMSYTEIPKDPFESAPFSLPSKNIFLNICLKNIIKIALFILDKILCFCCNM
jgi:AP2-associated kinase